MCDIMNEIIEQLELTVLKELGQLFTSESEPLHPLLGDGSQTDDASTGTISVDGQGHSWEQKKIQHLTSSGSKWQSEEARLHRYLY